MLKSRRLAASDQGPLLIFIFKKWFHSLHVSIEHKEGRLPCVPASPGLPLRWSGSVLKARLAPSRLQLKHQILVFLFGKQTQI